MYPIQIPEKYDRAQLDTLSHRFSVVYLGTYISGDSQENVGSHPGVDIRPISPNQNVFAVLDGTVFKAGEDAAYGKYVFLEHIGVPHPDDFSKTTTVYSCYQHLDRVDVETGQTVKEGDVIGTTGNTGISFGEHLHFQIDRQEAPYHAYWPYTGAEVRAAGVGFSQGVNIGLGKDKAEKYTINPLWYLDRVDEQRGGKKVTIEDKKINTPPPKTLLDTDLFAQLETLIGTNPAIPVLEDKIEILHSGSVQKEILENNQKDLLLATIHNETSLLQKKSTNIFGDINPQNQYYNFIMELYKQGVVTGFGDNTFRPNNSILRIELLKMILLYNNIPLSQDENTYFQDVFPNSWHKKYVNTALEKGIITNTNPQFSPNNYISRVEALKIILTLFVGDIEEKYSQNFVDIPEDAWYKKYVEYAVNHNFFEKGTHFFPNKKITRMEVISILFQLKNRT